MIVKSLPEVGDLVVVKITQVKNFGAEVTLEEYPGVEGYIHISEVATGWVKHIRSYLREGQRTVCKVLNVNTERKNVDLSLKRVNSHQSREKISEWKNEQKADKLFEILCQKMGRDIKKSRDDFGSYLVDTFGTLYSAFESAALSDNWLPDVQGDWKEAFVQIAKENISSPEVSITGYFEAYSTASDGIDRIKRVFDVPDEFSRCSIEYVGAPRYRLLVTDKDYKQVEDTLKRFVQLVNDRAKKEQINVEFSKA